jgi:hypothetical protein
VRGFSVSLGRTSGVFKEARDGSQGLEIYFVSVSSVVGVDRYPAVWLRVTFGVLAVPYD